MINLDITLLQLNDLYYAVSKHTKDCEQQIEKYGDSSYFITQLERAQELETIVQDALHNRVNELQEAIDYIDEVVEKYEDEGPTYDSAGYSNEDRVAEQREDAKYEKAFDMADVNVRIHFVDNDEADEDASTLKQDEQRYADKKAKNNFSNDRNGVSQFILDFVQANNVVSYTEMNDMYKAYTKGSNSFSHILKALMIPYKNRPTRRYIVKTGRGGYTVRTATPQNWVVVDDKWFPGYRRPVRK